MPPTLWHEVRLGASFRAAAPPAHHTLRYSFKPSSADFTRRGRLEVRGGAVDMCVPSKGAADPLAFSGKVDSHKGSECVLICRGGRWTLERLHLNVRNLKAERPEPKKTGVLQPPPPRRSPSQQSPSPRSQQQQPSPQPEPEGASADASADDDLDEGELFGEEDE